jgi:hypothetical protein
MQIRAIPDPTQWERWEEAKALLEPARARGDFPDVIEPDEALFVVMDGDDLMAAATAWLGVHNETGVKYVEVKLIGGREHRKWLQELDNVIGAAARGAGATRMLAIGRAGWWKTIRHMGWERSGEIEDQQVFTRDWGDGWVRRAAKQPARVSRRAGR